MKLIAALARTFGVHPGFFLDDFGENQAGQLQEQVELLALVRHARLSSTQLRVFLGPGPEARQAIIDLIAAVTAPVTSTARWSWQVEPAKYLTHRQIPAKVIQSGAIGRDLLMRDEWSAA